MSQSHICMMTFPNKACAQSAQSYLTRERYYCLPLEEGGSRCFLAFIIDTPQLTLAQWQILNEFYATDIEVEPLNARLDYQNYCHSLYYNSYAAVDEALERLICGNIDQRAMTFEEPETSAYTWRVVFCTRDEIEQEQRDRIMDGIVPDQVTWNDPVVGNTSPTSFFT